MALNFPSSPTNGQIYYDTTSGNRYIYDSASTSWKYAANNDPATSSSDTQVLYNTNGGVIGSSGLTFSANTLTANTINTFSMRVTGNLYIGSNTVTITGNTINAETITATNILVAGSAIPTGQQSNAIYDLANAAYSATNSVFGVANAAFTSANNVAPQVKPAFDTANDAYTVANSAYGSANGVNTYVSATYATTIQWSSSFAVTNAAFGVANAAFNKANNAGGGYFSGNNGEVGGTAGRDDIFRVHTNTLSSNVTIYSGNNALCAGPLYISGDTTKLTVEPGARLAIV